MAASGGAIANLLRVARAECRATVAFAVVENGDEDPEVFRVPTPNEGSPGVSDDTLAEVARRASGDPEFGSGRPFVRTVQLTPATILAVAPIRGSDARGMVGVLCDDLSALEQPQLELLDRLARRVDRHIRALRAVGPAAQGATIGAGPARNGTRAATETDEPREPVRTEEPIQAVQAVRAEEPVQVVRPGAGTLFDQPVPMPPPLGLGGFGDEPRGVVVPSGCEPVQTRTSPGRAEGTWSAGAGRFTSEPGHPHDPLTALPGRPPAAASAGQPEGRSPEPPAPAAWWAPSDPVAGLPSLGQFFSRAGRLLGSEARLSGAVALVLVEVPDERTTAAAARALAAQLRFTDPLARVDRDLFAAAVLLFPGSMRGETVEERLGAAVRSALDWLAPVRTSHVLAQPGDRRDVDELLRQALSGLPGRTAERNAR